MFTTFTNWVIVTARGDEINVLGIFDSEQSANAYIEEARGTSVFMDGNVIRANGTPMGNTVVRPILAAMPMKTRQDPNG